MRITGGQWASRTVLGPPRGAEVRPTPDALREQAFAVLAGQLAGATFLDLFAGTGVVSLEALSRGAARVVLCERAAPALALIRRNFAALDVPPDAWELIPGSTEKTLARLRARGIVATLAWCDPPFGDWDAGMQVLATAGGAGVLAAGALVVVELPPRRAVDLPGFEVIRPLRGAVLIRYHVHPY